MSAVIALVVVFVPLSLLAFGGGNTVLPEIQRAAVHTHQWMTATDFAQLFAIAQAAPGPNLMIVPLVGWHVAGLSGLLAASVAKFGPSSVVAVAASRTWDRFKDRPWRERVQVGIRPATAGVVSAGAVLIAVATVASPGEGVLHCTLVGVGTVAAATITILRPKLSPLLVLGGGAVLGALCSVL